MPNTGKSTFFNRITGASARVGNWPGVTVDLMGAKILVGGEMVELVDLPGIYDLHGFSDDEQVVRHFLENNAIDLVLVILNSCQLDRQLSLALQLRKLNLPMLLLLNMADEAKRFGITVDADKMSKKLDIPVQLVSAKYGDGYKQAFDLIEHSLQQAQTVEPKKMQEILAADNEIEKTMDDLLNDSVSIPVSFSDELTQRIDKVFLHPWLGLPIFFGIMYLLFQAIFLLGSPLQEGVGWVLDLIKIHALEPLLAGAPKMLSGILLDGIYAGVGTVATFVPIIILFFLFMAIVEDTGYLSRAAFLMDTIMARMGLDGRSFVMMLMGFGCNVPALMGTRIMRSRPLRLLTMMVIPLSLCSARLQVFIFLTAALFSPKVAPLVLFSLYLLSFATAFLTAILYKRKYSSQEPFVLELPPYRFPTLRQMILRGWHEVRHFLNRATKFIVAGVVLVWILTNFPPGVVTASEQTWAGQIGHFFAPVLDPLGIDTKLAIALIFGFVAKEIVIGSLAVIYSMEGDALSKYIATQIDWVQAYSFMIFTLVYTPCLSTVATMRSESRSTGYTVFVLLWSVFLAWVLSFIFYQSARALGY